MTHARGPAGHVTPTTARVDDHHPAPADAVRIADFRSSAYAQATHRAAGYSCPSSATGTGAAEATGGMGSPGGAETHVLHLYGSTSGRHHVHARSCRHESPDRVAAAVPNPSPGEPGRQRVRRIRFFSNRSLFPGSRSHPTVVPPCVSTRIPHPVACPDRICTHVKSGFVSNGADPADVIRATMSSSSITVRNRRGTFHLNCVLSPRTSLRVIQYDHARVYNVVKISPWICPCVQRGAPHSISCL